MHMAEDEAPAGRATKTSDQRPARRRTKAEAAKAEAPAKTDAAATRRSMSASHKEALAAGREEGRAVRAYLEVINRPKRPGRKRTAESVEAQLAKIEARLGSSSAANRLALIQERFDLQKDLAALKAEASMDLAALESAFIAVAPAYGQRKSISYAAWREAGVNAEVLRRAGITRRG
jgi:hypothetical protein